MAVAGGRGMSERIRGLWGPALGLVQGTPLPVPPLESPEMLTPTCPQLLPRPLKQKTPSKHNYSSRGILDPGSKGLSSVAHGWGSRNGLELGLAPHHKGKETPHSKAWQPKAVTGVEGLWDIVRAAAPHLGDGRVVTSGRPLRGLGSFKKMNESPLSPLPLSF